MIIRRCLITCTSQGTSPRKLETSSVSNLNTIPRRLEPALTKFAPWIDKYSFHISVSIIVLVSYVLKEKYNINADAK